MSESSSSTIAAAAGQAVHPDRPVVLVGMMGSGKTSIGRRLARALGWIFQDADWAIEDAAGTSIANIFAEIGEAAFRRSERHVVARLLEERQEQVLALGGGAFVDPTTRSLVKAKAISLWLSADLEILVERTARRDDRPLLSSGDPREVLGRLLLERTPFYAEADITIDSGWGSQSEVVARALDALARHAAERAGS